MPANQYITNCWPSTATQHNEPYWLRLNRLRALFLTFRQPHQGWMPCHQAPWSPLNSTLAQMSAALAARVHADSSPGPARSQWLLHWCQQEGVPIGHILQQLQARDYSEVHHQTANTLAQAGLQKASLEHLETLSLKPFQLPGVNAKTALALIQQCWLACQPSAAIWLQQLIAAQRLCITTGGDDMAWCLDTPFGAYVRVDYQPDFTHLMTLVHELGHAYHQDLHRAESSRPLRYIEKETAALKAEQQLLLWLTQQPPPYPEAVKHYWQYQYFEMHTRQWLLSQFEFDLYRLQTFTPSHISSLWCAHLHRYYGPQIELNTDDAEAWAELPELLTAPFYRLSYPLAYARSLASVLGAKP